MIVYEWVENERTNKRTNAWMNEYDWLTEWMSDWVSEWMNEIKWMNVCGHDWIRECKYLTKTDKITGIPSIQPFLVRLELHVLEWISNMSRLHMVQFHLLPSPPPPWICHFFVTWQSISPGTQKETIPYALDSPSATH